jgi:outer membrane protein OmpA-like peptidoglycan-associated protein
MGARGGFKLDGLGVGPIRPHFLAGLSAISVSADLDDAGRNELLEGFYVGAELGAGFVWPLSARENVAVTTDFRRTFANNIARYTLEAGIRYTLRGRNAYVKDATGDRSTEQELAAQRALEESLRVTEEREAAQRNADQEAQKRLAEQEAQRREAEFGALEAQRDADQARRIAEESQRSAAQAETARLAEVAARQQAEREATEARAVAEAAQRSAREAQERAAAAELRLYESLLDLDRLISNITGIEETERGMAVVLGQGLFASGQSNLSATARGEVGRIAAVLNQFTDASIAVEGHTDADGSELSNQRLSENRADAVRAALIAEGVHPSRIELAGFGEGRPIATNETAAGRAENRRVEIVILGARRPAGSPR